MCSSIMVHMLRRNRSILNKINNLSVFEQCHLRFKGDKKRTSDISSSTILLQDGIEVQELPVIIRKIKDILHPLDNKIECVNDFKIFTTGENNIHRLIEKEFKQCNSINSILFMLSKCTTITPNIALGAMERIYALLDANQDNANYEMQSLSDNDIMDQLLDIIIQNEDIYGLLRALKTVSMRNDQYLNIICDEILGRVSDNKLSIKQICDVIDYFGNNRYIEKFCNSIESLWIGFVQRDKEFDADNIVNCLNIFHHMQTSRKVIFGLLEKKIVAIWWQMSSNCVIDILNSLSNNNITSSKIYPFMGRWLNTNIHAISEDDLLQIINKFTKLNYSDKQIEKALERYIKLKALKVDTQALIATVLNHLKHFRIRNIIILDGCIEYFIAKGQILDPIFIKPLLYPIGYLNYRPNNASKFWSVVEEVLDKNFSKMNQEDIIDTLQMCIYMQKYPLNFIPRVFNSNFFEKVNSSPNVTKLKHKLKMLDTALSLECEQYKGPLLPKDLSSKSFWVDGRIKRLINYIGDIMEGLAGGPECFSTSVLLPNIYSTNLYIVDVMFHPKGLRSSILNWNLIKDRNINVAVLIHTPDHLCSNCDKLIGPQEMRIKHMRILGLKVVTMKFETLSRLYTHRLELENYMKSRLKEAQDAI